MIKDRGGQFTTDFDAVLANADIRVLTSPPAAPTANATCKRMIGTRRRELFNRTLILGEHHLRQIAR
jgi:putative transposase